MTPQPPADLAELAAVSARIGADPLLIQGAGGNTSVKEGAVMWIKASGTLLAEAEARAIFVPVDLPAMRASLAAAEARADRPAEFALPGVSLRPSIETSLHAVIARRVVIHVHCVATIALAIRTDACEVLADRLAGFHWAFVPYARPGARLAALVAAARGPQTDVIVLGNHGLIVAADTVAAADALLARVTAALAATVRPAPGPDATALAALAGAGYAPAALAGAGLAPAALAGAGLAPAGADHPLHGVATDPARLALALQGSAWPDHVIFCGPGSVALHPGETPADAAARHMARGLAAPVFILVPGQGALLREDAGAGALALARCLGEVLARVEPGAAIVTLSDVETAELLDWDAEKYRQSLNAV